MKRLSRKLKIDRHKIFNKYGGRCAYCGIKITVKNFQVDHIWPQHLAHWEKGLDSNREENLNPTCRKCNNYKHGMRIPDFRKQLQRHIEMLMKNAQFNRALRFGQVIIIEKPITFYFEVVDETPKP